MIEHVKPNAYLSEPMKEDKCQEAVSHMKILLACIYTADK